MKFKIMLALSLMAMPAYVFTAEISEEEKSIREEMKKCIESAQQERNDLVVDYQQRKEVKTINIKEIMDATAQTNELEKKLDSKISQCFKQHDESKRENLFKRLKKAVDHTEFYTVGSSVERLQKQEQVTPNPLDNPELQDAMQDCISKTEKISKKLQENLHDRSRYHDIDRNIDVQNEKKFLKKELRKTLSECVDSYKQFEKREFLTQLDKFKSVNYSQLPWYYGYILDASNDLLKETSEKPSVN